MSKIYLRFIFYIGFVSKLKISKYLNMSSNAHFSKNKIHILMIHWFIHTNSL